MNLKSTTILPRTSTDKKAYWTFKIYTPRKNLYQYYGSITYSNLNIDISKYYEMVDCEEIWPTIDIILYD